MIHNSVEQRPACVPLITIIIIKSLKSPAASASAPAQPAAKENRTQGQDLTIRGALPSKLEPDLADVGFLRVRLDLEAEAPAHLQHDGVFVQYVARNRLEAF